MLRLAQISSLPRKIRFLAPPRSYANPANPHEKPNHPDEHSDVAHALHKAADFLPHQGILDNFIHHNPLAPLENMHFQDAIDHIHGLSKYNSPAERAREITDIDPLKRVNESLVELSSTFLDRGAAKWAPSFRDRGFLYFFAQLEDLGVAPWRKHAREAAHQVLSLFEKHPNNPEKVAEIIIKDNLEAFGVPVEDWEHALRSTLLELRGWAGMFHRMEVRPDEAPHGVRVTLIEFAAVQSILVRASLESLAGQDGIDVVSKPEKRLLVKWLRKVPSWREVEQVHETHSSALAYIDQSSARREKLEEEFERSVLSLISPVPYQTAQDRKVPDIQIYTCIDDRTCSFRRYMEESKTGLDVESFGVAGFFGVPIKYKPADGRDEMTLAPEGNHPPVCLVEHPAAHDNKHTVDKFRSRRRILGHMALMWEKMSFSPIGSLALSLFAPFTAARLMLLGYSPSLYNKIKNGMYGAILPKPKTDFELPYSVEQGALLLSRTFRDIGTHRRFAPIVVIYGHGSESVNNPFAAAYNCGACGGRDGGPNARLFARLANDPRVRASLAEKHGVLVPEETVFVGAMYNTTTDCIEYFDVDHLKGNQLERFNKLKEIADEARGLNALERCNKFLHAEHVQTPLEALRHVQLRATDISEVRPELNHATNAAVIIGRRSLTKGHSFERRAFLPSYDPFADDDKGTNLEHVLAPALIVCSGINLEYLFSAIQVDFHGAGTKVPLNIVGHLGVLQGTAGDLRPGLPTQMTEMHVPVRALYVVDAPIARVEAVLSRRPELMKLVRNEWVILVVRDPVSGRYFYQEAGGYFPLDRPPQVYELPSFSYHRAHGLSVTHKENWIFRAAAAGMVAACIVPIGLFGATALNPFGPFIALGATSLALPTLGVARRYLHGEAIFTRVSSLMVGLLVSFNMVALAPDIEHILLAWSLFGFCSTFLIGAYNERPTVRNNATFAFSAYRLSDFALLVASTFAAHTLDGPANGYAATGLLIAALLKSSQFPLTMLFVRSMEGPTPASALGYAGLSAHVGVVLLASTLPMWYVFDWARITVGSIGLITAVYASLVAKTRADRKGSIANMTAATLGMLYFFLALGFPHIALGLSFGHAAFRMIQILRSPSQLADSQTIRASLGAPVRPKVVPDFLYRFAWSLRRLKTDLQPMHLFHSMGRFSKPLLGLTKLEKAFFTTVVVVLAGAPYTPFSHWLDHSLMEMLPTHPFFAVSLMAAHFALSVVLVRFLFVRVLHSRRVQTDDHAKHGPHRGIHHHHNHNQSESTDRDHDQDDHHSGHH